MRVQTNWRTVLVTELESHGLRPGAVPTSIPGVWISGVCELLYLDIPYIFNESPFSHLGYLFAWY